MKEKYRNHIKEEPYCYMCDCIKCKLHYISSKILLNEIIIYLPSKFWYKLTEIIFTILNISEY